MDKQTVIQGLERVREKNPLIHNITNIVVANFTANGLLALGASPFMSAAEQEVADAAKISDAIVLNIGTLNEMQLNTMLIAGKSANNFRIPVILDPVGVGATPFRTKAVQKLLHEIKVTIIRGNAAEISQLAGDKGDVKGVDAGKIIGNPAEWVKQVAEKYSTVAIATGENDYISDGKRIYIVRNGHPLLTKVTGSGCLLSAVTGAFRAAENDSLTAAVSAVTYYGVAAERAAEKCGSNGPGSFQTEFLNQLSLVPAKEIEQYSSFEPIKQE